MPDWPFVFSHTCSGVPASMPETSASATTFFDRRSAVYDYAVNIFAAFSLAKLIYLRAVYYAFHILRLN